MSRPRSVRLALESLDGRTVPANLTVAYAAGTLTVVGDAGNNVVTVEADPADPTHFTLTSSTDTFNGQPSPYSTPTGVKNLSFKMGDGSDTVGFSNINGPTTVEGTVTVNGGDGNNAVFGNDLTVGKNLSVTNGTATGFFGNELYLSNANVGRNVTVRNAGGNSQTEIYRSSAGVSTIRGNLTVTNGTGMDSFYLSDTNVDHNVTIRDGHGSTAGYAGNVGFYNNYNTAFRSVIGGNLTVSYPDGNMTYGDLMADLEVMGNVTLNHGTGAFTTNIDGSRTRLPVYVHGNLSLLGTGADTVNIGYGNGSGLRVGKNFTLTSGGGSAESLSAFNWNVGGNTSVTLNNGGTTATIDDSDFAGTFTLKSGAGNDTVNLETRNGTTARTVFHKPVLIDLGGGTDTFHDVLTGANVPDAGQALVIWSKFAYKGVNTGVDDPDAEFFPNGGEITT